MARDHHASNTGPADVPPAESPPDGFARIAKQISRWTVNLVATAAVLLLMLVLGQQLSEYWHNAAAPASLPKTASKSPTDHLKPPSLENTATVDFGSGQLSMLQSHVAGDRAAAVSELGRLCRVAAQNPVATIAAGAPQPAESRLLSLLASEKPAERLDESTELFEMPGAVPMAVVTKIATATAVAGAPQAKVAAPRRRVVMWGIALRTSQRAWVVYAFHPPSRRAGSGRSAFDSPTNGPLPQGAEPLLSVQRGGSSLAAFRASATTDTTVWREFYDRWARTAGYSISQPWTDSGGVWRVRLRRAKDATVEQVDIQFGPDGQGGLRGLITSTTDTAAGG